MFDSIYHNCIKITLKSPQRCYGRHFIHVTSHENLLNTSGLSILMHDVIFTLYLPRN